MSPNCLKKFDGSKGNAMESIESFVDGLLAGDGDPVKRARYIAEFAARDAAIRAESASALSTAEQERDALLEMLDKSSGAIDVSRIWCDRCAQVYRAEKAEYERDALKARCAELEARLQGVAEQISKTLQSMPAQQDGGGFINEHFDQDGNYQGSENVPEAEVVQLLHGALIDLRAAILGEKEE